MRDRAREDSVLIVGAGPTGLTAAIELARRGIRPRIVDRAQGPAPESRALGINPRTLAVLEPSGATGRLLEAGHRIHHLRLHGERRTIFKLDLADLGGPHPFMLVLPQGEIESLLAEVLGELGVAVEWQTELVSIADPQGPIRAELSGPNGIEHVQTDRLIAADGAHSTVRRALALDFPGSAYETAWGLADARVRTELPLDSVHAFDRGAILFAVIPIRGDLVRLVCNQPDVLEHVPPQVEQFDVTWLTTFRISHRQTETYQVGNVCLAGDAAHIHSPLGARGMNLGIEDAAWLAWQLAEGDATAYTSARHPVGREVLRTVNPATRLLASDAALPRLVRQRLLPLPLALPAIRRQIVRRLAGESTPFPPWLSH